MRAIKLYFFYIFGSLLLTFLSYGFLDVNLTLTHNTVIQKLLEEFRLFSSVHRPLMTLLWIFGLSSTSVSFLYLLHSAETMTKSTLRQLGIFIVLIGVIYAVAYPANSYDLFNYITTAKVSYTYMENPYVVMPIEFIGEPYLAFTRAANKVALYGPVWILLTAIPHALGVGNIWTTILAFKLINVVFYLIFLFCIFRITSSVKNVIFFAFNPLVVLEVLLSGHNDIYMMLFSLIGMYFWWHCRKISGFLLFFISWFVKGMTIIFFPLFFMRDRSWEQILRAAYWIAIFVFFIFAPLREELYPWYAVWFISIASLMDLGKNRFIYFLTIVLSLTLELRHLPYMWMGYYEGPGPMLRILLTVVPVAIFLSVYLFTTYKRTGVPRA